MTDVERGDDATLFPRTVGERLRAKREALGLSLAEVAARTRVPLRHLEAIEAADYAGLPSATYAVGFVRAYARAVGDDEVVLARDVRAEVAQVQRPTPRYEPYEIADPSRVPSRGLVIVAAGVAIAVLVLAVLWFAVGFGRGSEEAVTPVVAVPVPAAPVPVASPTPANGGQVALTATDELWMEVYDAGGARLFTGTMKAGQTFDVPPDAKDPMINIGRPDKLSVTLNGSKVAPLGSGERAIKDVRIGAAALTSRAAGASAPAPAPAPVAEPSPVATSGVTRSRDVPPAFAPRPRPRATPSRTPASRATSRPRPRASPSREGPENLLPSDFATDRP